MLNCNLNNERLEAMNSLFSFVDVRGEQTTMENQVENLPQTLPSIYPLSKSGNDDISREWTQ